MINPDFEINQLKWQLRDTYDPYDIEAIGAMAYNDIMEVVADIVSNAATAAILYAESNKINDFLYEMQVVSDGSGNYNISTSSGRTDFSIPAIEMLPHLLKNAKTSKKGVQYKVIPLHDSKPPIGINSDESRLRVQQSMIDRVGQAIRDRNISQTVQISNASGVVKKDNLTPRDRGPVSKFRTATSNQDPHSQWVLPAREKDMTEFLMNLNNDLQEALDNAVNRLINSYLQEYS